MSKSDGDHTRIDPYSLGGVASAEQVEAGFAVNDPSHSTIFIFSSLASPTQETVEVAQIELPRMDSKAGHQNQGSPDSLNILNHGSFFSLAPFAAVLLPRRASLFSLQQPRHERG